MGWVLAITMLFGGCGPDRAGPDPMAAPTAAANATVGAELIRWYGCGTCHVIPGIRGAVGMVGPPLTRWSHRAYIAGTLANTPANLRSWIVDPQAIEPGTAMPTLGVTSAEASHIGAYLYTLR